MFEHFAFGPSRSPSDASNSASSSRDVSPCSSTCSSPTSPIPGTFYSVADLTADLDRQHIHHSCGSHIARQSCAAYANADDDAGWTISPRCADGSADTSSTLHPSAFPIHHPRRTISPSRHRHQRQLNARLLCTASHHRDIAALVARMLNSHDQCSVAPPVSIAPSPTSAPAPNVDDGEDDDEGYDSDDQAGPRAIRPSAAEYRRAADPKRTGASFSKDIRLRRESAHRRRRR